MPIWYWLLLYYDLNIPVFCGGNKFTFSSSQKDLEFGLRSYCQKVIVKGKPLSGAHLLFTSERMAVRAYYPCDLIELEQQQQQQQERKVTGNDSKQYDEKQEEDDDDDKDNFDGLLSFLKSFQLALVLFVLPPSTSNNNNNNNISVMQQLDDVTSHFHRAQRLAGRLEDEAAASNNNNRNLRVMIFPDTNSAIEGLINVANVITPERKESKRIFLQRLEKKYFLPNIISDENNNNNASSSNDNNVDETAATVEEVEVATAIHVAEGIRKFGDMFELPEGEVDILMSELKDLQTIATADDSLLDTIPIEERTRKVLHSFFGSMVGGRRQRREPSSQRTMNNMTTTTAPNMFRPQSLSIPPPPPSSSFLTQNPHRSLQSQEAISYQMKQQQQHQHQQYDVANGDQNMIEHFWTKPASNSIPISSFFQGGEDEIPDIYDDNINTTNTNNGDIGPATPTRFSQRPTLPISSQAPSYGVSSYQTQTQYQPQNQIQHYHPNTNNGLVGNNRPPPPQPPGFMMKTQYQPQPQSYQYQPHHQQEQQQHQQQQQQYHQQPQPQHFNRTPSQSISRYQRRNRTSSYQPQSTIRSRASRSLPNINYNLQQQQRQQPQLQQPRQEQRNNFSFSRPPFQR
jgi:hypothetical protein